MHSGPTSPNVAKSALRWPCIATGSKSLISGVATATARPGHRGSATPSSPSTRRRKALPALPSRSPPPSGLDRLRAHVAHYWPEFAQNGKGGITRPAVAVPSGRTVRADHRRPTLATSPIPNGCQQILAAQCPLGHPAPGTATTPCRWAGTSRSSSATSTRPGARWAASSPTRSPARWTRYLHRPAAVRGPDRDCAHPTTGTHPAALAPEHHARAFHLAMLNPAYPYRTDFLMSQRT